MTDVNNETLTKYNVKTKLSEGVTVFEDGNRSWGDECNRNFELLNENLKAHTLTVKVGVTTVGTFNTKENSTITLTPATDEQINSLI